MYSKHLDNDLTKMFLEYQQMLFTRIMMTNDDQLTTRNLDVIVNILSLANLKKKEFQRVNFVSFYSLYSFQFFFYDRTTSVISMLTRLAVVSLYEQCTVYDSRHESKSTKLPLYQQLNLFHRVKSRTYSGTRILCFPTKPRHRRQSLIY